MGANPYTPTTADPGPEQRMPRKVRILYTIPNFVTAGSGQAMVNIIDRLDRNRFEPTVAVSALGGALVDHLETSGVRVIEAPFSVDLQPLVTLPLRIWSARRPFRNQFDLWHSFNWRGEFTEPLIAYASGARAWVFTKKNMGWGTRSWKLRSLLARRIAVQNDVMPGLFFHSRWLRHKVRYIPTGIDVEPWQQAAPDTGLRSRLGIAPADTVIVCVGNVMPGKNQAALVEALPAVPHTRLILAGRVLDETYASSLVGRAAELGVGARLHLIGQTSDVPGLLRASDVFALLSYSEGSPVALLEAMAVGLPAVCSAIPGINERVADGVDGFLVGADDHDALADRLVALVESADLRRRIGEAAQRTAELRGRVETEAARYETLYLELRAGRWAGHNASPRLGLAVPSDSVE